MPFLIWPIMIFISAISSTVNTPAKIQKVVCTEEVSTSDTAARVGIRRSMIQGCRPTSATTQPAIEQRYTNGMHAMAA